MRVCFTSKNTYISGPRFTKLYYPSSLLAEFNWENVINFDSSLNVGETQPRITLRFEAKECQNKLSSVFKSSSPEAWWKTMQGEKVAEIGESQPW